MFSIKYFSFGNRKAMNNILRNKLKAKYLKRGSIELTIERIFGWNQMRTHFESN